MWPRSSRPAKPTTMLRPSDSRMYSTARFVMRTHAVPIPASANGSAASTTAISTTPIFANAGCFVSINACMALRPVRDAFAEQARWTEYQHGDQHEEREHVLVVAAEQRQVRVAYAALGDC